MSGSNSSRCLLGTEPHLSGVDTFAFHEGEEIGPVALARIAKATELQPDDLWSSREEESKRFGYLFAALDHIRKNLQRDRFGAPHRQFF